MLHDNLSELTYVQEGNWLSSWATLHTKLVCNLKACKENKPCACLDP